MESSFLVSKSEQNFDFGSNKDCSFLRAVNSNRFFSRVSNAWNIYDVPEYA